MKILITGTSKGIGKAIADKFLSNNHIVYGLDVLPSTINNDKYHHYICDVSDSKSLPDLSNINIIINNAGINDEKNSINVNLIGYINVAEKYAFQKDIKSVLNIGSICATSGIELPLYCASNGGRLAYTKNLTLRLAKYKATVNTLSPGGVYTDWNEDIFNDFDLSEQALNETLLKKWSSADEIAEFAYFLTVVNKSMTGQNILVDNGESSKYNYIATEEIKKLL